MTAWEGFKYEENMCLYFPFGKEKGSAHYFYSHSQSKAPEHSFLHAIPLFFLVISLVQNIYKFLRSIIKA